MVKEDKKEEDPLAGCPVPFEPVNDAQLLSDVRSPRFLQACQQLLIDPLELKPRAFDSFRAPGLVPEQQQVRYAVYEKSRMAKWRAINDCRARLPRLLESSGGGSMERQEKEDPLELSWIHQELSKSKTQVERGKAEAIKIAARKLRDISAVSKVSNVNLLEAQRRRETEAKVRADFRRKQMIKKQEELIKRKNEMEQRNIVEQEERKKKMKELDEALTQRIDTLRASYEKEAEEKRRSEMTKQQRIQDNINKKEEELKEHTNRILENLKRKEEQAKKRQEDWMDDTRNSSDKLFEAERRRQEAAKSAEDKARALVAAYKRKQAEVEKKEQQRLERQREIAKERRQKENEKKKKIVEIQKKKENILQEKASLIMDHMKTVEENLAACEEKRKLDLLVKSELSKLKSEVAKRNVQRSRMLESRMQSDLEKKLNHLEEKKKERERMLDSLKKERHFHATQIRLQKDE
mmetsp:Transcript_34575/g.108363  ORF Transcript_34575/g.108363 Transcript_34575/m.108363 type:complete len:465 (+) Transcript_34575:106-1500(+)